MKEKYKKPEVISNERIEGVIPAGLVGAIAAFSAGVAAGTQVKKMVSGGISWEKERSLVEGGVMYDKSMVLD